MAAEMKVTDAAVEAACMNLAEDEGLAWPDDYVPDVDQLRTRIRAALEAGLAAMLEPVGYLIQWDSDGVGARPQVYARPCHPEDGTSEQLYRIKESK